MAADFDAPSRYHHRGGPFRARKGKAMSDSRFWQAIVIATMLVIVAVMIGVL